MALHIIIAQGPHQRRVGETRVNHPAAHPVVHGLLGQGRGRSSQAGLGGGVGDLPFHPLGGHRTDENDRALGLFIGSPFFQPAPGPLLRHPRDHFHAPVRGGDQVDLHHLLKVFPGVNDRLPRGLVDLHGQGVPGEAGGRDADGRHLALLAHFVIDPDAEGVIAHIALVRCGDGPPHRVVDLFGDGANLFRLIHHRHSAGLAPGQFEAQGPADAAGPACHDRDSVLYPHSSPPLLSACQGAILHGVLLQCKT